MKRRKNEEDLGEFLDTSKETNLCMIRVPEEEEK
jgi:hypothetical protein